MLYWTEVAVCSDINTKEIKCGQDVKFLNVKLVGASLNKQALKVNTDRLCQQNGSLIRLVKFY